MSRVKLFPLAVALTGLSLVGAIAGTATSAKPPAKVIPKAAPAVDAATLVLGERAFAQCKGCHSIAADGHDSVGPNLHGVFGKKAGTNSPTYAYSTAMKTYGAVWNDQTLNAFLQGPSKAVPGTKMPYRGLTDDATRAALVSYIRVTSQAK